jgi:mRNA interferase RelE/StbE
MRYEIEFAADAATDLRRLKAALWATVKEAIEEHLRHEPTKTSRSRIKRLRGLKRPQYRLRVGETRVFYDVSADAVQILGVVNKSQADEWLKETGESDEASSAE